MEIEGQDGSKTQLKKGLKTELGRGGLGFDSKDRTVSRRHVSFKLHRDENQTHSNSQYRVYFEVIGRNPIWVYNSAGEEIRVFRPSEEGGMEAGDIFCVSAKKPLWFTLKRSELEGEEDESPMRRTLGNESEFAESLQGSCGKRSVEDLDINSVDVAAIDPVKEFGFLVMGHEFDLYPKQMIRPANRWSWFLEEPKQDSDDEEVFEKRGKKDTRRKRKKAEVNDEDEWTGESEEDKGFMAKSRKLQTPKYSTRSKDIDTPIKDSKVHSHFVQKKSIGANQEDEDEDGDDDTLGGFIVADGGVAEEEEEEEEIDDDEEEEEDYDEEDDEE